VWSPNSGVAHRDGAGPYGRAARYGAPLGIYIAKTKPGCENMSNSTDAILTQITGNAKWVLARKRKSIANNSIVMNG